MKTAEVPTTTDLVPAKPASMVPMGIAPEKLQEIEGICEECNLQVLQSAGRLEGMLKMATGIKLIRQLIPVAAMQDVMELQGTALGFRTDKDQHDDPKQRKYPVEVVRDCVIEAMIRGLRPIGNEFNIIAGGFYATKNGLARLVKEFRGLTDLKMVPDVPQTTQNGEGAVLKMKASWRLNGAPNELTLAIPIRLNRRMGVDAILGKGKRKMLAAIYEVLTGSEHTFPEGDATEAILEGAVPAGGDPSRAKHSELTEEIKNFTTGEGDTKTANAEPQAKEPEKAPAPKATNGPQRKEAKPSGQMDF